MSSLFFGQNSKVTPKDTGEKWVKMTLLESGIEVVCPLYHKLDINGVDISEEFYNMLPKTWKFFKDGGWCATYIPTDDEKVSNGGDGRKIWLANGGDFGAIYMDGVQTEYTFTDTEDVYGVPILHSYYMRYIDQQDAPDGVLDYKIKDLVFDSPTVKFEKYYK